MTSIGSTALPVAVPSQTPTDSKAQRDAEKLRDAREAVEKLKQTVHDARADRKAAAKQKLDALKERLRQLQMLGASPRQIAQLAKELAQAVKAYGAGSGAEAPAAVPTAATPAASTPAAGAAPAGGEADAAPDAPIADAAGDKTGETPRTGATEEPKTPYEKALRAQEDDAAQQARRAAASEADRQFLADARQLAKELKAAAREAARKARREDDPDATQAAKAADEAAKAVEDAERAVQNIGGGAGAMSPGLFLSV